MHTQRVLMSFPLRSTAARTILATAIGLGAVSEMAFAVTLDEARLSIRTKQYDTAQKQLTELAQAGNIEAQYALASLYRNGIGIKRDYAKSLHWYTQAAEQKNGDAAYQLGAMHETGRGTPKSLQEAMKWYTMASANGSDKAQIKLDRFADKQANVTQVMGTNELLRYIRNNDLPSLQKSLSGKPRQQAQFLNSVDKTGYTPLTFALEKNNIQATEILIKAGASPDYKDAVGETPLTFISATGNTAMVKVLLKAGANINLQNKLKNTPLHIAVDRGHADVAKVLLAKGAKPNIKNSKAFTALDYADTPQLTSLLKKHGATAGQLSVLTAPQNKPSDAVLVQNLERQNALLAEQENPFTNWPALNIAAWRGQLKHAQLLVKNKADIDSLDDNGLTPLARASWQGHIEIVQLLLNNGANVRFMSQEGETPLGLAVTGNKANVAEYLLEQGATSERSAGSTLEPLLNMAARKGFDKVALGIAKQSKQIDTPYNGKTPLMWAAEKGNVRLLRELLAKKIDVNQQDAAKRTALWLAADTNNQAILDQLLAAGANTALRDTQGNTPLAQAIKKDHTLIAKKVMQPAAIINQANEQGNTPLMLAAQNGNTTMLTALIQAGAELETRNNNSLTAIMVAAENGQGEAVKLLIDQGANANRRTRDGESAADLASAANHQDVVSILKGAKKSFF